MGKVATEKTLETAVHYLRIIAEQGETPTSWQELVNISMSGNAKDYIKVGDVIEEKFTLSDSQVYTNVWVVVGYKDVELDDGEKYSDVPIIQMQYSTPTTISSVVFDAAETDACEAGEIAVKGIYYVGYKTGSTDIHNLDNFVVLTDEITVGSAIPSFGGESDTYAAIYRSDYNTTHGVARGLNNWKMSFIRQWLNNSGTGWAKKQHKHDVLPSGADTLTGFETYMPTEMLTALHPIKILTQEAYNLSGNNTVVMDETFDKFWLLSPSEMCVYHSNISDNDGEPLDFYKELLADNVEGKTHRASDGKYPQGTYTELITYALNEQTSAQYCWLRSANLGSTNEWSVNTSGGVNANYPYSANRAVTACAII